MKKIMILLLSLLCTYSAKAQLIISEEEKQAIAEGYVHSSSDNIKLPLLEDVFVSKDVCNYKGVINLFGYDRRIFRADTLENGDVILYVVSCWFDYKKSINNGRNEYTNDADYMTYEYQRKFNKNAKNIQIKNNQRFFPNIYIGTYEDLKRFEQHEYNFWRPGGIYVCYRFGTPVSIHDKRL